MQKTLFFPKGEHIMGNHVVITMDMLDTLINQNVEQVVFMTSTARYVATIEELQEADDIEIDDRWYKSASLSLLSKV